MKRLFLLSLILASCLASASLAAPVNTVLNPGRDAEFEKERRDTPVSPWGLTVLVIFGGLSGAGLRRALKSERENLAKGWLAMTSLLVGLGGCELAMTLTSEGWATHIKVRDGCYHDNPRGYFQPMTFRDDAKTLAYCAGPLRDVWERCDASSPARTPGTHRVLALGDSFTDGVGVFAQDAWPAQLDSVLGATAEVVNCGRAASFTSHVAKRYLSHRARHDANLVIYALVLNDVPLGDSPPLDGRDIAFQAPNRDAFSEGMRASGFWGSLAQHSSLGRFIGERLTQRRIHNETMRYYEATYAEDNGAAFTDAIELIDAMHTLIDEDGGRFLVVIWPLLERLDDYPFRAIHTQLATALEAKKVPTLDLLETFSGKDATTLHVHATDHHPNEIAHKMAAHAIAQELKRRSWTE